MKVMKVGVLTEQNEIVGPMHAIAPPILTNLPSNDPDSGVASTLVNLPVIAEPAKFEAEYSPEELACSCCCGLRLRAFSPQILG